MSFCIKLNFLRRSRRMSLTTRTTIFDVFFGGFYYFGRVGRVHSFVPKSFSQKKKSKWFRKRRISEAKFRNVREWSKVLSAAECEKKSNLLARKWATCSKKKQLAFWKATCFLSLNSSQWRHIIHLHHPKSYSLVALFILWINNQKSRQSDKNSL